MTEKKQENKNNWTRRNALKLGAASAVVASSPSFFIKNAWAAKKARNFPIKGSKVMFGFNVPQTGAYADEGADELRAYKLAVKHINNGGGMLNTMKPLSLKGDGILGKKVDYVVGDTRTNADGARTAARRMIERDGVIMWGGGSSSSVAIAQQTLAQEMGVVFMCGLTHSNDTTGKDKRRYGFRHFFNAYMSGKSLAPILAKKYGKNRRAFHLTSDYTWGWTQYDSMKQFTEKEGWTTVGNIMTPVKNYDYSQFLTAVLNSDADVLVLNHYGKNMTSSLPQAVEFGMREMQKNGKTMEVVVPLYSRLMAQGAGSSNIDGVLGTTNWNWTLQDAGSQAFVKSFEKEYNMPPSQAAQTCYVQTLLYADAAQRAGTFYAPELIKSLEDLEFDGMGTGKTLYRGADHQCFKDILVVQGKGPSAKKGKYDLLDIVSKVPRKDVEYPVNTFKGELGSYIV